MDADRHGLKPISEFQPPDRPYHISVSGDGRRFAACSPAGTCRLFDSDLRILDEFELRGGVGWVRLDESGTRLLVGFHDHVGVYATAGNISLSSELPIPGTAGNCCVFPPGGRELCVASWHKAPELTAWDLDSGERVAGVPLPDRGGGGYTLTGHPEGEAMAAVAYSGQSEEWMFWAHYARGRLRVWERPEVVEVTFPHFHPTGRELISRHNILGLCRVGFPSGEVIASVQPEEAFPDDREDHFSYQMHFLDDCRFLVWQECLSLHEFDLATLKRTRVVLSGAGGMTFGEGRLYSEGSWILAGGRLLTSDCKYDDRFRERIDTLRLWDASELIGQGSTPDAARPYTEELLKLDA